MMKFQMKRKRFTLIEMIAVVAIAGMLIALFAPAFNRMMFGSKVDQAASNFKLGLEMAQAKAVAARKYVAMIIPCNMSDIDPRLKNYCLGGYRLAYVKKKGGSYVFADWVSNSPWRNADDGARLVRLEAVQDADSPWLRLFQSTKSKTNDDLTEKDLLPAVAESDSLSDFEDKILLEVKLPGDNGIKDETDQDMKDLRNNGTDDKNRKNCFAIIFSPYGGIVNEVAPILFYFTETRIDGNNNITYQNPDNVSVLMLNSITGRVEYVTEDYNK